MSDQNELVDFLVQNLEVGPQDKNKKVSANSGHQRQVRQPTGQKNANVNGTGSDQNGFPNTHKNMMGSNNVNNMSMYTNQSQQGAQIGSPYMYAPSNSDQGRDREWAEYVQLMNIPGIQTTSGYPMDQRAAYASPDDLVYGQSQDEANFVQNFVQSPQFLPFLPGYFQHPAFTNQLYSDGRNMFPGQIYGFQQQYLPPGQMIAPDSFQNNLANNYAYSKLVQNVPIDPNELNAELTETDLDQNGQAFYTLNHAMGTMSIQDEKPRANPPQKQANPPSQQQQPAQQPQQTQQPTQQPQPKKSNAPRSWADIANTPASKVAAAPVAPQPKQAQPPAPGPVPVKKVAPPTGQVQKPPVKGTQEPRAPQLPTHIDLNPTSARFFVIKSYQEDDIHKSIKYNIWASTDSGNRRLDAAYKESHMKGPIYLFFSVNASGQFCGMAQMVSALDYNTKSNVWELDKWNGQFAVKWIFIKDIPNNFLRHIRLENNDNKPVTNSRDTQEILMEPGKEMLRIFATFKPKTSLLDDFSFYDQKQEELQKQKEQGTDTSGQDENEQSSNDNGAAKPSSNTTQEKDSEDGKGKRRANKK